MDRTSAGRMLPIPAAARRNGMGTSAHLSFAVVFALLFADVAVGQAHLDPYVERKDPVHIGLGNTKADLEITIGSPFTDTHRRENFKEDSSPTTGLRGEPAATPISVHDAHQVSDTTLKAIQEGKEVPAPSKATQSLTVDPQHAQTPLDEGVHIEFPHAKGSPRSDHSTAPDMSTPQSSMTNAPMAGGLSGGLLNKVVDAATPDFLPPAVAENKAAATEQKPAAAKGNEVDPIDMVGANLMDGLGGESAAPAPSAQSQAAAIDKDLNSFHTGLEGLLSGSNSANSDLDNMLKEGQKADEPETHHHHHRHERRRKHKSDSDEEGEDDDE